MGIEYRRYMFSETISSLELTAGMPGDKRCTDRKEIGLETDRVLADTRVGRVSDLRQTGTSVLLQLGNKDMSVERDVGCVLE